MDYLLNISTQLGIPILLLVIILVWTVIWKLLALWKSARKGSIIWFIILALFNTVGIIPILYIFIFSKMKFSELKSKNTKKAVKKKKTKKKK